MRIATVSVGPLCLAVLIPLVGSCAVERPRSSAEKVLAAPQTGMISVEGGRVWYAIEGHGTRTPLLVLHGGPGIPHDYLSNLALLGDDRPVVLYDQLGCGQSDRPDDPTLWTRERFSREVDQVRNALGLDEVILYGHSWGSMLAVDYVSGMGGAEPVGVRGLILAGPALDMPRWVADSRMLVAGLPADARAAIEEGERSGKTDSEAYQAARNVFYGTYVCRLDPWPAEVNQALEKMGEQVYGTMNGPSEFTVTGTLKDVILAPELGQLRVPVLYTCGEFDEATPETTRAYASMTAGADVAVVAGASHLANVEKPVEYMGAVRGWLAAHDL